MNIIVKGPFHPFSLGRAFVAQEHSFLHKHPVRTD